MINYFVSFFLIILSYVIIFKIILFLSKENKISALISACILGAIVSPLGLNFIESHNYKIINSLIPGNISETISAFRKFALPILIFFIAFCASLNFPAYFFYNLKLSEIKKSSLFFFSSLFFQTIPIFVILFFIGFRETNFTFYKTIALSILISYPLLKYDFNLLYEKNLTEQKLESTLKFALFNSFISIFFIGAFYSFFIFSNDNIFKESIAISIFLALAFYLLTYFAFDNDASVGEKFFYIIWISLIHIYFIKFFHLSFLFGGFLLGLLFKIFSPNDKTFDNALEKIESILQPIFGFLFCSLLNNSTFDFLLLSAALTIFLIRIIAAKISFSLSELFETTKIFFNAETSKSKTFIYSAGFYSIVFFFDFSRKLSEIESNFLYIYLLLNLVFSFLFYIFSKYLSNQKR